ncbi:MAG: hypothetical protein N2C12_03230 [Planctomycetales bacterium]
MRLEASVWRTEGTYAEATSAAGVVELMAHFSGDQQYGESH